MNREAYSHILRTYGRSPSQWFGFFAVLLSSILNRVVIVIIMANVATNLAAHDFESAKRNVLYFLIVYVSGALIWTVGELVSLQAESRQYEALTLYFHDKLINKDMSFYRDNQTGYLATVFRQHLDAAMSLIRFVRGEAMGTAVSLAAPVFVLLRVNFYIGLIALAVVATQMGYVLWSSARARVYRQVSHEVYRKITAEVSDEITNIVAFKAGGLESTAHNKLAQLAQEESQIFWLRRKTTILLDLPRGIITAVGMAASVYTIIALSTNSSVALGLMVLTLTYMFQLLRSVAGLPELIQGHDDLITKLAPTLRYLTDEYETIQDPAEPVTFAGSSSAIDIQDISFGYDSRAERQKRISVFKDFTVHIMSGDQVGVVGLSGAGKSTLANLLMRFDEIDGGSIMIGGVDIRAVPQSDLRQKIAYVPQEPLLFHRTVFENVTYYSPDANKEAVIRAAKAAHAHEFIQALPNGYDTMVGERGVKLSGGQKQRIAIARAVLKDAPIMIFDEATSALDSESEQVIQQALPKILGKRTALIIAHRLSTVAKLDRIIVMHGGRVVEQGTHDELLHLRGRYYALWQKQTTTAS